MPSWPTFLLSTLCRYFFLTHWKRFQFTYNSHVALGTQLFYGTHNSTSVFCNYVFWAHIVSEASEATGDIQDTFMVVNYSRNLWYVKYAHSRTVHILQMPLTKDRVIAMRPYTFSARFILWRNCKLFFVYKGYETYTGSHWVHSEHR